MLDIVGYNYMIFKHKTDHERDPKRVMWQTESYPRDAYRNYETVANNSYVIGDMVWTGLDYLGESGKAEMVIPNFVGFTLDKILG